MVFLFVKKIKFAFGLFFSYIYSNQTQTQSTMKQTLLLALMLSSSLFIRAQHSQNFWSPVTEMEIKLNGTRDIIPEKYKTFHLSLPDMKAELMKAPLDNHVPIKKSPVVVSLPMPNGSIQRFYVVQSPIMQPELQNSFSHIRTFSIHGIDDAYASGKLDFNDYGFHGMIRSPQGDVFIDPFCKFNTEDYISYYTADFVKPEKDRLPEIGVEGESEQLDFMTFAANTPSNCAGADLRTYRIAVGCTGQYAAAATGTSTPTTSQVLSKVVTTINRVDGVYETEVAVRLVLVNTTTLTLYTKTATTSSITPAPTATAQPYTGNANAGTLINESQNVINTLVGSANYDIGHTFSTGGGGLANLGCVCSSSNKARGITGSPNPVGDPYDIDYVAHEVGHQFRGNHTFRANTGSCSGNGNLSTSVEPGSGVTIMAYAGICGTADNITSNSIPYFHAISYNEITQFIRNAGGNTCDVLTSTGNNPPNVIVPATSYVIPAGTPFSLTGSATDPEGDALTYQWEEIDAGTSFGTWNSGARPFFRSYAPTINPTRNFPILSAILSGSMQTTKGEFLPTTSQNLNFRLTARDNKAGGGGVCYATTQVSLSTASGPFTVSSQNTTGISYPSGSQQTVSWNKGNTDVAPFNVSNVNIYISTNNGTTFTLVAANTANDGSELITLPTVANTVTQCRVKVESVGNIFFDINDRSFAISTDPTSGINEYANAGLSLELYPNPFSNIVRIAINSIKAMNADQTKIMIYDVLGNLVRVEKISMSTHYSNEFDFSNLANGTYLVEVSDGKYRSVKRLIKM